jgi:hypothetical protein
MSHIDGSFWRTQNRQSNVRENSVLCWAWQSTRENASPPEFLDNRNHRIFPPGVQPHAIRIVWINPDKPDNASTHHLRCKSLDINALE